MAKILTIYVLAALAALSLRAESADDWVRAEVSFFPLQGVSWRGLYYAPNGNPDDELVEINFNPLERTPYRPYRGPRQFSLYAWATNLEGTRQAVPVATANLDREGGRQILLVEQSGRKVTEIYPELTFDLASGPTLEPSMFVFPDSSNTFPRESIVFYNTTPIPFDGVLGNQRIRIDPGLNSPINLQPYLDSDIRVGLAIHDGERHRRVLASSYRFSPDRRTLMILKPPASAGSLRIQAQRLTEYLGN